MKNNRILILTGGTISEEFIIEYLKSQSFNIIIAVDKGLVTADKFNLPITYIVGDFDSAPKELVQKYKQDINNKLTTIKEYNPIKDATDTQIAIELAIDLKADEIVILGATGTRLDHTIANINLLALPLDREIDAFIIDEHNKIYLLNQNTTLYKDKLFGFYVSLQPITEVVTGVTLEGFKYPLVKRDMKREDSLGISNEVIGEIANISLKSGTLIVIESKD
jgi:thiamine pyrophosphokinase